MHTNPIANEPTWPDLGTMNHEPETPPIPPHRPLDPRPGPSLWSTWPAARILGLAVLLMAGNFILQILFYSSGGGLFIPVLAGTIGGVFGPLYLVVRRAHLPARTDFSLHRPPSLVLVAAVLIAVAAMAPTSMLAEFSARMHPVDPAWSTFMTESMPRGPVAVALAFLAVVVAAPLAEEIIFRGLVHRLAARLWGPWPAAVISSLVFGVVHFEPWYLLGLVGIGFVLAVVYEATGSVLACWVTHMVHNGVSLAMMIWSEQPVAEPAPLTAGDWLIAAGSLVFLVLLCAFLLQARRPVRTHRNPGQG